ncbi:GNAT family N-acetyltransferase [Salininema proteolyticum]|uniref:GNAT family N-acetyltransferase n=1 Tax=Salininema proteolyticum TaxID=1607685 RepID=A0ABV8TWT0_9ACTN
MKIRDAVQDDWPHIWSFMSGIVAAGETFPWEPDTPGEQIRSFWLSDGPGCGSLVAEIDGAIAGTAEIHPNLPGQSAHIANAGFMVNPDYRSGGVGRALGEAAIDWARRAGYRSMQFNAVVDANTHAVKLWHSLGFETIARVPEGFKHPRVGYTDLHIMFLRL